MRKLVYILVAMSSLYLYSCFKDLGNYDYIEIQELEFTIPQDTTVEEDETYWFRVVAGVDTLIIEPEIEQNIGVFNAAEWDMAWNQDSDNNGNYITRSTDINLVYPVPLETVTGSYSISLVLIHKETGVRYFRTFSYSVSNAFSSGFLLLTEDNNNIGQLDMVSFVGGDTVLLHDIIIGDDVPELKNPTYVWHNTNYTNNEVLVSYDGGTIMMSKTTMEMLPNKVASQIKAGKEHFDLGILQFATDPHRDRLAVIDGNAFEFDHSGKIYANPINIYEDDLTKTYRVAPKLAVAPDKRASYSRKTVMYDMDNKCFTYFVSNSTAGRSINIDFSHKLEDAAGDTISWNTKKDFPDSDGLDWVDTFHSTYGVNGTNTTILTDGNGKYYAYRYNFPLLSSQWKIYSKEARVELVGATDIDKAEFWFASGTQPYIFYTVGSKVYGYDLVYGNNLAFTYDLGAEITAIFDAGAAGYTDVDKGDGFVYIATYGGTEGSAKVQKYSITDSPNVVEIIPTLQEIKDEETDEVIATKEIKWEGFNKIVSLWRKY